MPALISNTLYRFDVSIRSASILGLVGAGGIGYPLIIAFAISSMEPCRCYLSWYYCHGCHY